MATEIQTCYEIWDSRLKHKVRATSATVISIESKQNKMDILENVVFVLKKILHNNSTACTYTFYSWMDQESISYFHAIIIKLNEKGWIKNSMTFCHRPDFGRSGPEVPPGPEV